jgi:hypothetical protein
MSVNNFVQYVAVLSNKDKHDENILVKLEKLFLILPRTLENEATYQNFDDQISKYLSKISGVSKDICQQLLNRKALYIGTNIKKVNSILGCSSISQDNKLIFTCADMSIFDIDPIDITIGNIEELINQYYYQFIRCNIYIFPDIKKNFELHNLIIQYYTFLLLKVIKIPTLVDKKIEFLKMAIAILYFRHFLDMDAKYAKEKALALVDQTYQKEFDSAIPDAFILKYNNIKDILKLVIDLKIVFDTPNNLTYQMLNNLKVVSFLSITSTFDHLVAALIASITSTEYYKPLLINRQIQEKVEQILASHFNNIKYEELDKYTIASLKREKPSND